MKLSFPYMGPTIVYAKLLGLLGHDIVMPPKPDQEIIDLGVKYSPEFACFPFKVITGTYLKLMEKDVDTIITSGGHGPCRAGYYGEVHKKILYHLGYRDVDIVVIDSPADNYKYFYNIIKKLKNNNSWFKVLKILNTVYKMSLALDELEKEVGIVRAYSKNVEINKIWKNIEKGFCNIKNKKDIKRLKIKYLAQLSQFKDKIPAENKRLRIAVVGEIFVVMEDSINYHIEEKINHFGFEVERSQYLSSWIRENIIPLAAKDLEKISEKGKEFIKIDIGGHARENIGHIIDFKERNFDGIIHLKPFACLPELISQSVMDSLSEKYDIPILTISIDEQTASANILTRLEAFLDMIKERKYREVI